MSRESHGGQVKDPLFINFEPKTQFTRREFVMTTLATGFAAAVQPVAAQTVVTTDAAGPRPPAR